MAGLVYDLIEVLEHECKMYNELLELSKSKIDIIISEKVEDLQTITNKEQIISSKLLKLEKDREVVITDICTVLNLQNEDFSLKNLIQKMNGSEEEKEKLTNLRTDIIKVMESLKEKNEQNGLLINESIELMEYTMNAIRSANNTQDNSYQYGGSFKPMNTGRSYFDTKQ